MALRTAAVRWQRLPVAAGPGEGSALDELLADSVVYERAGAPIPRDLVKIGSWGAVTMILAGVFAGALPTTGVTDMIVPVEPLAIVADVLELLCGPLLLLGVSLYALQRRLVRGGRRSGGWARAVIATEGVGGILCTPVLVSAIVMFVLLTFVVPPQGGDPPWKGVARRRADP